MLSIQAFKMVIKMADVQWVKYSIFRINVHIVLHVKKGKESSIFSFRSPLTKNLFSNLRLFLENREKKIKGFLAVSL